MTVTDREGRAVADLSKEDFIVYEEGKPQNLSFFRREQRPVSWGLVLDRSGSMARRIEEVYKAALHSVEFATAEDEFFVMTFNDNPELVQPLTSDRQSILRAINGLRAEGDTALYDAGALALDYMKDAKHRKKVLVIVTDGEDNESSISFKRLLNMTQKSEVMIYTVGFFASHERRLLGFLGFLESRPRKQLRRLAEETGGQAYFPANAEESITAHRDIAYLVSRQYSLGYYPSNTDWSQEKREIRIKVLRSGNHVVRSRKSYFVPRTGRKEYMEETR